MCVCIRASAQLRDSSGLLVMDHVLELLDWNRKLLALQCKAGSSSQRNHQQKTKNVAWMFVTGMSWNLAWFYWDRGQMAEKIRAEVAPFLRSKSALLSESSSTVLSPLTNNPCQPPQRPNSLCLIIPGLWLLKLSDTTEP